MQTVARSASTSRVVRCILVALGLWATPFQAPGQTPDEDVLGEVVVEPSLAGEARMMRVALPSVVDGDRTTALIGRVVRNDLELSGQFRVADDEEQDRIDAVIRVSARSLGYGELELGAHVQFGPAADSVSTTMVRRAAVRDIRSATHRLADAVIGALTGVQGPFSSRLSFVAHREGTRSAYVIDPDGQGLTRVTQAGELVSAAAYGPGEVLYYASSRKDGRYRLYRDGEERPLTLDPPGSVYGIAFSPDSTQVALTIATGRDIRLYTGPADLSRLSPVGRASLAMSPVFGDGGRIAIADAAGGATRIWIGERAVSPRRGSASSPDFCHGPQGVQLVYALGTRSRSHIVIADPHGGRARQLTSGPHRNSHPTCSPDGRLIAFFSTRRDGEGPGLYLMRTDGRNLRKIANVHGDGLRWQRWPAAQPRGDML